MSSHSSTCRRNSDARWARAYKEGQEQRNSNAAPKLSFVIHQMLSRVTSTGKGHSNQNGCSYYNYFTKKHYGTKPELPTVLQFLKHARKCSYKHEEWINSSITLDIVHHLGYLLITMTFRRLDLSMKKKFLFLLFRHRWYIPPKTGNHVQDYTVSQPRRP
jgi:hypothetical protein